MAEAVEHAEVILMVVPTQFVARTMTDLAKLLQPSQASPHLDNHPVIARDWGFTLHTREDVSRRAEQLANNPGTLILSSAC